MEDIKEIRDTKEFLDIIENSNANDTICLDLSNWDKRGLLYNFLKSHNYISIPVYNNCGYYKLTLRFKDYAIANCVFELFGGRYLLKNVNFSLFIKWLYLPTEIHIQKDIDTRDIIIYPEYNSWKLYIANKYIGTYLNFSELKENLESNEIMKVEEYLKFSNVRIS